jgi:PAS domain-containing protein
MAYNGMTVISSPFYSTETGEFVLHIYTPIGPDKILVITQSGMTFADLVSGYKLWDTGNIYMFNEEGTMIADVEPELVLNQRNFIKELAANPDSTTDEDRGIAEYMRDALTKEKDISSYHYKGVERLVSYRLITGTLLGWRVAVAAPLNESPKAGVQKAILFASLLFLAIGIILAVILSIYLSKPYKELEKLHDTVRAQSEHTKILLDSTPLAGRLWNMDLKIIDCNEETLRLFGIKEKQEFFNRYFDLLPEFQPDGKRSKDKAIESLEKAFKGERVTHEWIHLMPDGTLFPTEITLIRVPYGDGYAVAGYTRDLREYKKMMDEVEQHDMLLRTGNTAAEILLTIEDEANIEAALLKSMEVVGHATNVDRVHIWRDMEVDGEFQFVHTFEWLSEFGREIGSVPIGLTNNNPQWKEMFLRNEYINAPLSAMQHEDRIIIEEYGMKSVLIIPLFLQDHLWGFFSLDDCRKARTFTKDEVGILRSVSLMMASAINRSAQTETIREAHERTKMLLDSMPFIATLWNRDCKVFVCY